MDDREYPVVASPDEVLLDVLRHRGVTSVKEGCREGDCGACVVLVGEPADVGVRYTAVCSCLTPFGDVDGAHVVTVAGLTPGSGLNEVQSALLQAGGTQCGFCTPGFVVSLTGYLLSTARPDAQGAAAALDGNLCRCTGHVGILRAAQQVVGQVGATEGDPVAHLVDAAGLPEYMLGIPERVRALGPRNPPHARGAGPVVAGGTDAWVRHRPGPDPEHVRRIWWWQRDADIVEEGDRLRVHATATVEQLRRSPVVGRYWPDMARSLELFGSTPIRSRATVAGNLVTASPIGDLTCMLMALDAGVVVTDGSNSREVPLRGLYTGYKQLAMTPGELVEAVMLPKPGPDTRFGYEKVSRRRHLDVASVCCAMRADVADGSLSEVSISVGGVGPTVLKLPRAAALMQARRVTPVLLEEVLPVAQTEISPISDVRGSAEYKRLLVRQLLAALIDRLLPGVLSREVLP